MFIQFTTPELHKTCFLMIIIPAQWKVFMYRKKFGYWSSCFFKKILKAKLDLFLWITNIGVLRFKKLKMQRKHSVGFVSQWISN